VAQIPEDMLIRPPSVLKPSNPHYAAVPKNVYPNLEEV